MQRLVKAFRVKRPARPIDEAANAIGLALRHVLAAQFPQPTGCATGFVEIEQAGVQDPIQAAASRLCRFDPRTRIQRPQDLDQLRLLRDEVDIQAAQRTNQNLYILSIITALMLPATLVTGLFGMNTGGMPLADGPHGTLVATLIAGSAAGVTYWLLRQMGLMRR